MDRASVIIVTYNHRAHIQRCLDLLETTLSENDDVIVVDNASTDDTAEYVDRRGVRVERLTTNIGFGGGCNYGAQLSRARYLVFLNPDTEPQPGWLNALLLGLEATPNAGLATAKLLLTSRPDRIDAFGNDLHISGIPTCHGWGEPAAGRKRTEEVAAVSGACFAISRPLFQTLGGFDERLFLYYEDDDLSLRARLAGYSCIAVPDARVLHDHAPGFSAEKLRHLERNRWWALLKVYRKRTLLALLPVLLGAEVLAWSMAVRSGPRHAAAKARAWLELSQWLYALGPIRRRVQATRRVSDAELLRLHGPRVAFGQVLQGAVADAGERAAAVGFAGARRLALKLIPK